VTVHLIHGFNVSDGGKGSIGQLRPHLPGSELLHNYGWTGLLMLRCTNREAVRQILPKIKPGDFLIGHSNGALICWELAELLGDKLGGVVVINPALRRDTLWRPGLPVLCLHNSKDWVVQLGRVWGRLVSLGGLNPHGWGAAGRYGFNPTTTVANINTADEEIWEWPVQGHSSIFKPGAVAYWAGIIDQWIKMTSEERKRS